MYFQCCAIPLQAAASTCSSIKIVQLKTTLNMADMETDSDHGVQRSASCENNVYELMS